MRHLWSTITQIKEIEGIPKSLKNRFKPIGGTPLWKLLLGQNPLILSHSTYIICLWNDNHQASKLHPSPSFETTLPKSLSCTPTSVWAVIIWLWHVKPWPAKDGSEERDRKRELHPHPPVWSTDRVEENGTPLDAAICLWTPFKKNITGVFFPLYNLQWFKLSKMPFHPQMPTSAACSNLIDEGSSLTL